MGCVEKTLLKECWRLWWAESDSPSALGSVLRRLHEFGETLSGKGSLRLALDRDPVSLL